MPQTSPMSWMLIPSVAIIVLLMMSMLKEKTNSKQAKGKNMKIKSIKWAW